MRVNLVERGKPVSFLSQKGREAVRPTHGGTLRQYILYASEELSRLDFCA
jgi:hypothetical protein